MIIQTSHKGIMRKFDERNQNKKLFYVFNNLLNRASFKAEMCI
jgi:hypothetical protein